MQRDPTKPTLMLVISGNEVPYEIIQTVTSLEVDLTFGMADQIKMKIANPLRDIPGRGYAEGDYLYINAKTFLPGNQVDVYLGWGDDIDYVASGIIQKWLPHFPADGMPTLELVALDASHRLMDGDGANDARNYPNFDFDTIIREVINRHGIVAGDIKALVHTGRSNLVKKAGMSDYEFVKALSNITGHQFKVYYDPVAELWKADWKEFVSGQTAKYHFTYGGPEATLLEFDPEFGLRNSPNEVKVMFYDPKQAIFHEIKVGKDEPQPGQPLKPMKKGEFDKFFGDSDVVSDPITSMSRFRVALGDVSVEVIPERPFENEEAAIKWATAWLKARRDNFITGQGRCIGLETLRPGEVHEIKGVGTLLSGEWEFRTVRHTFDTRSGYTVEFDAHKVLTQ